MSIFDNIANPAMATPVTAFLVGREQKRQRERQERNDQLNEEYKRTQLDQAERRMGQLDERIDLEQQRVDEAGEARAEERAFSAEQNRIKAENRAAELRREREFTEKIKRMEIEARANELKLRSQGKPSSKAPTSTQYKAAGFAVRLEKANEVFDTLDMEKFTGVTDRLTGSFLMPQGLKSQDRQVFEQAKRDFINAKLRQESGAAIAPSEFESADLQYFPVPGDKPDVLEKKRQNRLTVYAALAAEGGAAVDEVRALLPKDDGGEQPEVAITEAPPAAIEHLRANPQLIDQFEAKYGYRPEGF